MSSPSFIHFHDTRHLSKGLVNNSLDFNKNSRLQGMNCAVAWIALWHGFRYGMNYHMPTWQIENVWLFLSPYCLWEKNLQTVDSSNIDNKYTLTFPGFRLDKRIWVQLFILFLLRPRIDMLMTIHLKNKMIRVNFPQVCLILLQFDLNTVCVSALPCASNA